MRPGLTSAVIRWAVFRQFRRALRAGTLDPAKTFFDAGGDSLMAVELLAAVRYVFEVELPIENLISDELGKLALFVIASTPAGVPDILLRQLRVRRGATPDPS